MQYAVVSVVSSEAVVQVWWLACSTVDRQVVGSNLPRASILTFPQLVHDWLIKGLGMSSRVCATGHYNRSIATYRKE